MKTLINIRNVAILGILILLTITAKTQNFVDMHINQINKILRSMKPPFSPDQMGNSSKTCMRYMDEDENRTIILNLNDKGYCTSTSMMVDITFYKTTIDTLNAKKHIYVPAGTNAWIETKNGKQYKIEVIKNQWFYTIAISRKQ